MPLGGISALSKAGKISPLSGAAALTQAALRKKKQPRTAGTVPLDTTLGS